jgi:hypothetical protein
MGGKDNFHPPAPGPECRGSCVRIIVIVVGHERSSVAGWPIDRPPEESDAAGYLSCPDEAEARRLEGIRRVRLIAPASEPTLLVVKV